MFIENLSDAKKMWSLWGAAALAVANVLMASLPGLQEQMTPATFMYVNVAGTALIAFLRVLKQNIEGNQDETPSS